MSAEKITIKKVVELNYQIKDKRGNVLEHSEHPIRYIHGVDNSLFEKIEQALEGCVKGQRLEVSLSPEEGFGQWDPTLSFTDDVNNVPEEFRRIGAEVEMHNDLGEAKKFVVSKIRNGRLTVDGNHPLAGKAIKFVISVVDVRDATEAELQNGVMADSKGHVLSNPNKPKTLH